MDTETKGLLQRGVVALEKLADEPTIDIEVAPPVCPHCGLTDPTVRVNEHEASGKLSGFVIQCHCLHCNGLFYSIPFQFQCVKDLDEVRQFQTERAGVNGFNG
jgi:hypothetical protein